MNLIIFRFFYSPTNFHGGSSTVLIASINSKSCKGKSSLIMSSNLGDNPYVISDELITNRRIIAGRCENVNCLKGDARWRRVVTRNDEPVNWASARGTKEKRRSCSCSFEKKIISCYPCYRILGTCVLRMLQLKKSGM